jgi:hypothetical protein
VYSAQSSSLLFSILIDTNDELRVYSLMQHSPSSRSHSMSRVSRSTIAGQLEDVAVIEFATFGITPAKPRAGNRGLSNLLCDREFSVSDRAEPGTYSGTLTNVRRIRVLRISSCGGKMYFRAILR